MISPNGQSMELSQAAMDRKSWKNLVKMASDTYTGAEPMMLDDDDINYIYLSFHV